MKMINGVKMYDTKDVMEILNITNNTYRKIRQQGLLRSITLSGKLYTSEEALHAYLRGETLPPPRKSISKQVI